MSFILDALKKSQATRQQHAEPGTIAVEAASGAQQPHNWWAMVIAIMLINLTVVLGFIYWTSGVRRDPAPPVSAQSETQAVRPGPAQTQVATEVGQPASVRSRDSQLMPVRGEVSPLSAEVKEARTETLPEPVNNAKPARETPARTDQTAPVIMPPPASDSDYLPTLTELQLSNRIALSPLHIDVHVFNEDPRRRFVLVNTRKYKEGERLTEGPLLETIRRDGLVMYYRGQRFLVPRE